MANVDWFVISHRLCIAREASKQGWDVFVACEDTGRKNEIEVDGITFVDFKFSRSGTNPLNEIITLSKFLKLYKEINPDVVHHVTLKSSDLWNTCWEIFKGKRNPLMLLVV